MLPYFHFKKDRKHYVLFRKHFTVAPSLGIFTDRKSALSENLPHGPAQLLNLGFCRHISVFLSNTDNHSTHD